MLDMNLTLIDESRALHLSVVLPFMFFFCFSFAIRVQTFSYVDTVSKDVFFSLIYMCVCVCTYLDVCALAL